MRRIDANKKEVTQEYLQELRFKDIIGTITAEEVKILHDNGVQSFAGGTIEPVRFAPKGLIPKYDQQFEEKLKKWKKKWAKIQKAAKKKL